MPTERERLDLVLNDIGIFGAWIRGCDTKAGLLAAGLGIVVTNVLATRLWTERPVSLSSKSPAELVVLGLLVAAMLTTFLFLGLTLHPRLRRGESHENPFSFPSLCLLPAYRDMAYEQLTELAWKQKVVLAQICQTKHRMFRRALLAGGATMLLFVIGWIIW